MTERKEKEAGRQTHFHFLECMDKVNRAIQGTDDLEQMMEEALNVVLNIFDCDRTGLVYPCDPESPIWQVPMECSRPEYPSSLEPGKSYEMETDVPPFYRIFLNAGGPVSFGPNSEHPLPWEPSENFDVRSLLAMALYPKVGSPWLLTLHQCSYAREWKSEEKRLFQEIGNRLTDALTSLLIFRNLQESEARFRTFVDQSADAFFLFDATGIIRDLNRQACESLGYTRDELIGKRPTVFDTETDLEVLGLREKLAAGEVITFESHQKRKDGSVFPVEIRVREFVQDGKHFGVSLVRDITERKRAEAALAAKDEELRELAKSSPGVMGSFYQRPDGTVCMPYVSPNIWDLYGLRPEDVKDDATPLLNRNHPDDADKVAESIAESARTMTTWHQEFRIVHPTRGEIWIETSTNPQPHPDGGIIWRGFLNDITERKKAEEALEKSREHLSAIISSVDGIVWEADADTFQFTFVSPRAERLLGYPTSQWVEEKDFWFKHIHPEDRGYVEEYFNLRSWENRGQEFEYRMLTADGRLVWLRDIISIVEEDGQPSKLCGVMVDISAQKRADQRVRQLNRTYAVLSDINQLIVRERKPDVMLAGTCQIAVEKGGFLLAWIGMVEEASGTFQVSEYASAIPDIENKFNTVFGNPEPDCPFARQALDTGEHAVCNNIDTDPLAGPWQKEARSLNCKSLSSLPLKIGGRIVAVFNLYAGEPGFFDEDELRLLDELAMDIAFALQSYSHEEKRRQAIEQLRTSEIRFRELAETINEVFWVTDPENSQMLYISPAYEKIWGRTCQSLYDDPRSWLESIHPDDRNLVMEAAVQKPKGTYDVEYRINRPDGEERWISERAFAVHDKDGRVEKLIGVAQDISSRRELEEQFLQAQKMDAIGRLAGGIAHDFNNLLVPITGYVDMHLADMNPETKLYQDLNQVRIAADRAAELTGQILAFSRQQVLELATLDLNTVVKGFKQMLQRLIGEDIKLLTALSPSLRPVKADKGQIEQVLMNLAVNSRDAMPDGGRLTIETADTYLDENYVKTHGLELRPGHYVMLSISDTGQGMDAETQQRVFDPFFTTKSVGKGTGLGLSTVFGIVKQHRGHVLASSEPGSGTTFKVYLPVTEQESRVRVTKMKDTDASYGTETVLVVEDEGIVRNLVCETLRASGYNVIAAANPDECFKLAPGIGKVHLLLTDVIMPGMNGRELYRQLSTERPDCKVLYMSGYENEGIARHGVSAEGINYLKKPFTIHQLNQKVREVLDA